MDVPGDELLPDGDSRVGFIELQDDSLPLLPAKLARASQRIVLTIPYAEDGEASDRIEKWFDGALWMDDPARTRYDYKPPSEMGFVDRHGRVALIGCTASSATTTFTVNEGRVAVDYAVIGAKPAWTYRTIHGLRSEIDGLGTWMDLRSLDVSRQVEGGRLRTADLKLKSPSPVLLDAAAGLLVRPAFRFGPGEHPDETVVTERMLVESDAEHPRDWSEHLDLHVGIRDLVRVASWKGLTFLRHEATHNDDPVMTMDGTSHGRQWLAVETVRTGANPTPSRIRQLDFLFTYSDIGLDGVARWLELRQQWARAINPALRLLDLNNASLEVHFAQLCISLEALGYLLAIEAGVGSSAAGKQSFRSRIDRILASVVYPVQFDTTAWAKSSTDCYRQVKHADNPLPDLEQMYKSYFRGLHLFRAWIAGRLDVPEHTYGQRQQIDHIGRIAFNAE